MSTHGQMKIRKEETGDGTGAGAGANNAATLGAQSSEILALIAKYGNLQSTNNMRLLSRYINACVTGVANKQWIQAARERVHHEHVKTFTTLLKETEQHELDDTVVDWQDSQKCREGARALIALLKDDSTTWYNDQEYDSPTNQSIFGAGVLDARLLPRVVNDVNNDKVATELLLKYSLWYAVDYYTHELVEALCTCLTKEMVRSPKDEMADRDDAGGDGGEGGGLDEDGITKIMVSELPGVNIYLYEMNNKSRAIAVGRMHNTMFTYTHGDESPQWRKRPFVGPVTWRGHHTKEEEESVKYLAAGITAILMFCFDFSIGDRVQVLGAGGGSLNAIVMHVHPSGKVDVLFDKDKDTPGAKSVTVEHDKLTLLREDKRNTVFMLRASFDDITLD